MNKGCWITPLGSVTIDETLGSRLLNNNFDNFID